MNDPGWPFAPEGWSLKRILQRWGLDVTGVIHCGAWTGEEADQYEECGVHNVWWIEANPAIIDKLRSRVEPLGHHVIEALLGDTDGKESDFNVTNADGLSSSVFRFGTHEQFSPHMFFERTLRLKMRTLDSLVAEHGITGVNMLVMDLQGAEGLCLQGARKLLPKLDAVYTEVNTAEVYQGCVQLHDLDQMLFGFGRCQTWMIHDQGWGDAIYVRQPPEVVGGVLVQVGDGIANEDPLFTSPPPRAPEPELVDPRIIVVVPSWNCSAWIDRCLSSLKAQTRKPDEVLVIDDASTEPGYFELVKDICKHNSNWYVVRQDENRKMPYNLWWALREGICPGKPDDVIVMLDGDDYMPKDAIARITEVYRDPEVWLTWGSYERDGQWKGFMPNPATDWPENVKRTGTYRTFVGWVPFNHPLTFRRSLFEHLRADELQDPNGNWFQAGYDYAVMVPLTELAGTAHGRFLTDVSYVYNEGNPLSDNKMRASECGRVHELVRMKAARSPL